MGNWLSIMINQRDRGVAALEFALILPVLLLTLLGLFEISQLIYCENKMNRTAQTISNIVTRGDLTKPQLDSLLQTASLITQPFDFAKGDGNVIVTSVSNPTGVNTQIMWQDSYPGSATGSLVNPTDLPGDLILNSGQTVIVTEVFFTYKPLFPGYILSPDGKEIYALALAVPRKGQMTTLPPN